ncbi:hypothetical protein ABMA77_00930 [Halobacteriovorax sp. RZ-1]|uniref:hypothetical protein n=1 Tax=unclassified Halobacteriovorax TaxID=2639665 RepID=UPI00371BC081
MNRKVLLLFLFIITSRAVYAGHETGNGGDGVLCTKADGKTYVQFYDLYEAKAVYGLNIDLGAETLNVERKVELAINRLEDINPSRKKLYRNWFNSFYSETEFTLDNLIDVPDTIDGRIPASCSLEQVIVQRTPRFPGQKRYTIDKKLWDLMDNTSKASAILHELILREAVNISGHTNSISARYLNARLSTNSFSSQSLRDYVELIKSIDFRHFDAHGVTFSLFSWRNGTRRENGLTFYNDFKLKSGYAESYKENQKIKIGSNEIDFPAQTISFYKNSQIKEVGYFSVNNPLKFKLNDLGLVILNGDIWRIVFNENGNLKNIDTDGEVNLNLSSTNLICSGKREMKLKISMGKVVDFTCSSPSDRAGGLLFFQNKWNPVNSFSLKTNLGFKKINFGEARDLEFNGISFETLSEVTFHEGEIAKLVKTESSVNVGLADRSFEFTGQVEFNDLGNLISGRIDSMETVLQGKEIVLDGEIKFHDNGKIASAIHENYNSFNFKMVDGRTINWKPYYRFCLNENENFIEGCY